MKDHLYTKLEEYGKSDYYPFHMPGHKRNMEGRELESAYRIDITEIDGFDNLHHATGILQEAMQRAADLYHSEETHFLVNGSTCGILSSISATVERKGKILLARNCHKAAYNAVYLRELHPIYIYPKIQKEYGIFDAIDPQDVKDQLKENPDIQAVFITSPSYDGVVSNVKEIAEIVHAYQIPLIVDEAHGAHFGFNKDFPENSIDNNADIVIHSVHKTLPSFTQTALLHINGHIVDRAKINRFLEIYQTSSPSYVLMAGIDNSISIVKREGTVLFKQLNDNLQNFLEECRELKHIRIFQKEDAAFDFDQSKILISVKNLNITGRDLAQILLHRYHIQMEMEAPTYVIGIASIMDKKEGFHRLAKALIEIDRELFESKKNRRKDFDIMKLRPEFRYDISDLDMLKKEKLAWDECENRVSTEFIYLYPPGIPLIVPGEVISAEMISMINTIKKDGYAVQGPLDYDMNLIHVVEERK